MADGQSVTPPPGFQLDTSTLPPGFEIEGFPKPKKPVREQAAENLQSMKSGEAKKQYDQAQADAAKDIATYKGRVVKDVILAGGAAIAAPFTAGASLPAALAIMAGTGATASAVAEGVKYVMGSKETAKNFKELAWTLGFDAASFAGGEGLGRGIGLFVKEALPRMIMQSAAKVPKGSAALDDMAERAIYGLEGRMQASVGARGPAARKTLDVDIGKVLKTAEKRIADLPSGARGELGEQFGSMRAETEEVSGKIQRGLQARADTPGLVSEQKRAAAKLVKADKAVQSGSQSGLQAAERQKAKEEAAELVKKVTARLEKARGADSTKQPLDVLIKIKSDVQQFGYNHPQWREGLIFKDMGKDLDGVIRANLKTAEERELYNHYNTIIKAKFNASQAVKFANKWTAQVGRSAFGTVAGGIAGYQADGAKGAVGGAIAGAALGALPNVSAFILERASTNPASRVALKNAVDFWAAGNVKGAEKLAHRAFVTAGGREIVQHVLDGGPSVLKLLQ